MEETDYIKYLENIYNEFDEIFTQKYFLGAMVNHELTDENVEDICKLCEKYENEDEKSGTYRTILIKLKPYKANDKILEKFNIFRDLHKKKQA